MKQAHPGGEDFALWTPERRPLGQNFALRISAPLDAFSVAHLTNGIARPMAGANAWVADPCDPAPEVVVQWDREHAIRRIEICADADFDHAMETVLWGHPERAVPFLARDLTVSDAAGTIIATVKDNHQADIAIDLAAPVRTDRICIAITAMHGPCSAALIGARAFGYS